MKFMSYAKRRQISHTIREFLRGAGTGADQRGRKAFRAFKYTALASLVAGAIIPALIPALLVANLSLGVGALAYATVQKAAAVTHRVANKGIPEAPNHNRQAQRWGHRAVRAVAATAAFTTCAATAGFTLGTLAAAAEDAQYQIEKQMQMHPAPRQYNI